MKPLCMECGSERSGIEFKCSRCGGLFDLKPDFKYREKIEDNFPHVKEWVNLGEVQTPIVSKDSVSLKLDYFSPTFSYKDRGTRAMISYLKSNKEHFKIGQINEDSSGNAGASVAAYGSAAGFKVNIFVPSKTSRAKVDQIRSYGANIVKVEGTRKDVQDEAERSPGVFASHVKIPEFRDGIRSLPYEIFKQYEGMLPDQIFVPVSAGTLLLGLHSGLSHLLESGEIKEMPHIVAVQTEAVSPLCAKVHGTAYTVPDRVNSVADALVSTEPPLLGRMVEAISEGTCITVREEEIIRARNDLSTSGIYAEYSSATVLAAYRKKKFDGRSLLVLTGNGLKNDTLYDQAGMGASGSSLP